jgi:hypothetical protein
MLRDVDEFIAMRTGMVGARPDEWCAAATLGGGHTVYGFLDKPAALTEPLLCRFILPGKGRDGGDGYTRMVACQLVDGETWLNLVDNELFDYNPDLIIVYSRLSRICGGLQMDTATGDITGGSA